MVLVPTFYQKVRFGKSNCPSLSKSIVDVSLSEIPGILLSPCRYRFIDCFLFVKDQMLRLVEVTDFHQVGFHIYCIWKGNPAPDNDSA
jgi:hypothetical protein